MMTKDRESNRWVLFHDEERESVKNTIQILTEILETFDKKENAKNIEISSNKIYTTKEEVLQAIKILEKFNNQKQGYPIFFN